MTRKQRIERYYRGEPVRIELACGHPAAMIEYAGPVFTPLKRCIYNFLHPMDPMFCGEGEGRKEIT